MEFIILSIRNMKKYRMYFVKTLMALLVGVMFLASCKEEEEDAKSTACDILTFKLGELSWDISGTDITHNYSSATLPTPLTPSITVSPGATVSPPSGVEQNNFFKEAGVEYIVVAEDRVTTKKYTARAIRTQYSDCEILSFRAGGVVWDINDSTITYLFPAATTETSFAPTIDLSLGAKIRPLESDAQNFFTEQGVKYTVTSEDGKKTKVYTVKARRKYTDCDILSFSVDGEDWTISNNDLSITHAYPAGASEGLRTPNITLPVGATVNPPSGVPQDFFAAQGVKYTVRAEDTATTKVYTVKARKVSSDCEIASFSAGGAEWEINDGLITYIFPAGTTEGYLTPSIVLSPGAKIEPEPVSADLWAGVTYTVTAENGETTKTYTVKASMYKKYDTKNWTVLQKFGNHGWGDGAGTQTLWPGGNPMLILDDDPGSGWHSNLGAEFPHVLIIDMKDAKSVSKISGNGGDLHNVELYMTDNLSIDGYSTHTVNWEDDDFRTFDYSDWANPLAGSVPADVPASWGSPVAQGVAEYNSFSFDLPEAVQKRFLILRFPDNAIDWGATYTSMNTVEVFYVE
jgi:hypothetical protein